MPKITVDDVDYNTEDLTDNVKAQLASLQYLEVQMRKLQNEIAVYQTARNAYVAALKAELAKASEDDRFCEVWVSTLTHRMCPLI